MRLNLNNCGDKFNSGAYPNYAYNGTIRGILGDVKPRPSLITVQGCRDLCGEGSDYYAWRDISTTITTWVRSFDPPSAIRGSRRTLGTAGHWAHSTGTFRKQRELQKLLGARPLDRKPHR